MAYNYLAKSYNAKLDVMHVDFYREPKIQRWIDLGFRELMHNSDLVLIEWANLIPEHLPDETKYIKFEHYNNYRRILI